MVSDVLISSDSVRTNCSSRVIVSEMSVLSDIVLPTNAICTIPSDASMVSDSTLSNVTARDTSAVISAASLSD